jgi:hypothetical protein
MLEDLSDDEVVALSNLQMQPDEQDELSELLALNRENQLSNAQRQRLDQLMVVYRQGMIRKARALKVAVERGLIPPLASL